VELDACGTRAGAVRTRVDPIAAERRRTPLPLSATRLIEERDSAFVPVRAEMEAAPVGREQRVGDRREYLRGACRHSGPEPDTGPGSHDRQDVTVELIRQQSGGCLIGCGDIGPDDISQRTQQREFARGRRGSQTSCRAPVPSLREADEGVGVSPIGVRAGKGLDQAEWASSLEPSGHIAMVAHVVSLKYLLRSKK
jgi:hypothetical protein